ncbi:MAG: elongation factor G [Candidatus Omnitrophota bacterium]
MDAKLKRNFILLGHASSGKTTLAESILFLCQATVRKGDVAGGTTASDYNPDEIERKISINLSLLFCNYKGARFQLIDTPGYADFIGEVISGLRAVDGAVVVVDSSSGIELGTERAWELLDEQNIPRLIFINKLDKENTSEEKIILEFKERFSNKCLPLKAINSQEIIEAAAELDDALLEKYLEGKELSSEEVKGALHKGVLSGKIFPIISGSALQDKGVKELLDAIIDFLPNPLERAPILVARADSKEEKELIFGEDKSFSAFVFKTVSDPYIGQLTLLRLFSGRLAANSAVYNATANIRERIGSIYMLKGKDQTLLDYASCGDIVALAKLKSTHASDSLTDEKETYLFKPLVLPEPVMSASIKPKTRADEEKISLALAKLMADDKSLKVSRDNQTKEEILSGVGSLHLEVMVARLRSRFHVDLELGKPKVPYKETIKGRAKVQGRYKRQSGGRGQYGDVWIEVEPLPKGTGDFEFVNKIFGGAIPRNYIPAVEKGVRQACSEGAIAGYPLTGLRVILCDGSYHAVDSSDMAFQIAGAMALRKAVHEAAPTLLEPIMDVEILVCEEFMGQISGDVNSRRGKVMGMDTKGKYQVIKARIPLAEMFQYANDLRSMTGGRGTYTMHLADYEEVPHKIASTIISQYSAQRQQHEE